MDLILWIGAVAGLVFGPPAHTRHFIKVEQARCHCVCKTVDADFEDLQATVRPEESLHSLIFGTSPIVCLAPGANVKARLAELASQARARERRRYEQQFFERYGHTLEHADLFDRRGQRVARLQIDIARAWGREPPAELIWKKRVYVFVETVPSERHPYGVLHSYRERER